ncbi:MAG: Sensory box sensor histidine kinase/response regulator [uncultured bacterium]|nr:MAG: Sensory box sensor histidine kinase/response regulator [uncultured bacterium]
MQHRISLRAFLISALLIVLLPIVMASGWFFYRSALNATEQFAQQIADEVSGRVREKVIAFFDIPQRVVTFNIEQAKAGYLDYAHPDELMRQFLLQIRQQPQLTFVSMGMADGQYYAGSRPPLGGDKDLRMLQARVAEDRAMEVFRVDLSSKRGERISRSDIHFDARNRPWYKSAIWNGGMSWYAPYRYLIEDVQGTYAAMGMGVSAPVFGDKGILIGVATADLALSQVSDFLKSVASESGSVAFLADSGGELLGTSTDEPSFHLDASRNDYRVKTADSKNPMLRAVGELIRSTTRTEGNHFITVNGTRHLARWWTHQLPYGPELTMGVILPESQFNTPLHGVLRNVVSLTLAVMLASILFAVFVADRVVQPLTSLSAWAARLTKGDWNAAAPKSSPIRELIALSDAMGFMAGHLQQHAQHLEQQVAQRTTELEKAMIVIEQALTDERQFIAMLSHEVRSPLAVIDTAAQLLSFRLKDDAAQLAVVERIRRGSARLSNFFDNCLTQDRIDSQNFAVQPAPIDVRRMVSWVVESCAQLSNDQAVDVDVAPDLPALYGDEVLLRIALTNLLSNAFKYSPDGTTVAIRVWRDAALCCFAVEDCGAGIPDEEVAVIFEKYRRGRGAEGKPGAGLGLALVERIATLHGGSVRVERRETQGTRFVLKVPFQPLSSA